MLYKTRTLGYLLYGILILGIMAPGLIGAQGGENPFEISRRLGNADTLVTLNSDNPFDVGLSGPSADVKKKKASPQLRPYQPHLEDRGFLFWLVLLMLILLAIITSTSRDSLSNVYRSFTNHNFMSLMHRNMGSILYPSYMLLYVLFWLNIALFTLFLLDHWFTTEFMVNWRNYMLLVAAFTGIFVGKHILLAVMAWIFPFGKELHLYSFSIAIFNMMIGLILFPINILTAYTPPGFHTTLIYLGLGAIALILLLRSLRALLLANRYLLFHKFHFLLYLCGVELAPVLILVKVIENQGAII